MIPLRGRSLAICILMQKTYQFKLSVKDDKNDAFKTANIKISGRQNLAKWALTCYGGSTRERLLSESSRSDTLAIRLYVISCRSKLSNGYLD